MPDLHRFYLAFENNVCRDYVTEKLWRMTNLIVPIVLRASDYLTFLPNGSFIAADAFQSPAALAAYLKTLEQNQTEYLKYTFATRIALLIPRYFDWTRHYFKSASYRKPACDLCELLTKENRSSRINPDIKRWWHQDGICEEGFAKNLLKRTG
jgi:hypothetical protein